MDRDDWRRDNVNTLVRRLHREIHLIKPWVKFTVSPFGLYRPGHPEGMPSPIAGNFERTMFSYTSFDTPLYRV